MKLSLLLVLLSLAPVMARAAIDDEIVYLPEGQVELTDLMSPAEIYSDMLSQDQADEADLQDLDASATAATDPSRAKLYIYVSKRSQHLYVFQNGQPLANWNWKVSTGTEQRRCPPAAACRIARTPTGIRHPGVLDWTHFSRLYGNAPMHRAIQFVGGVFLHATYGDHIPMLGRRDSGGCVRQHPRNAERLFILVRDTIAQNTIKDENGRVVRNGREDVLIEINEQ